MAGGAPALDHAVTVARRSRLGFVFRIVGGALLVTVGAQFVRLPVPGTDVPMTLQLLAVLFLAFRLPPAEVSSAIALYLACGAAGLPVFAGQGGLGGSTGGYLVGFLVAGWLVSTLRGQGQAGWSRLLASGAAGTAVVFALGAAWRLAIADGVGLGVGSLKLVLATGVVPFLPKAVVELLFAVALAVKVGDRPTRPRKTS